MDLAYKVRARREELGLSQEELAARMGYKSRSSINKIENGRPVTQKIIARLSDVLDVSIAYLMGWTDEEPELQAEIEAEILTDPDLMNMIHKYRGLSEEKKKALRQMLDVLASD